MSLRRLSVAILFASLPASMVAQRAAAPTNVTVVGQGSSATVSWTPVVGRGVTYRVLRSLDARVPGNDLATPITTASLIDPKVDAGITYFYQVIALYDNGASGAAAPVAFTPVRAAVAPSSRPTAPTGSLPAKVTAPVAPSAAVGSAFLKPEIDLSGKVLTLESSSVLARSGLLAEFTRQCNPTVSVGGPAPSSFHLTRNEPSGPTIVWPAVVGAVAYVVLRAVDGTEGWKVAGTTCGSPNDIRIITYSDGTSAVTFRDISGGVVPGTTYLYQVRAFSASGAMGWNATRWTAFGAPAPQWYPPVITGSTAVLTFTTPYAFGQSSYESNRTRYVVTGPDGHVLNSGGVVYTNNSSKISTTVLGLPVGTYTFTATLEFIQNWDPGIPQVLMTRSSQQTITIKM